MTRFPRWNQVCSLFFADNSQLSHTSGWTESFTRHCVSWKKCFERLSLGFTVLSGVFSIGRLFSPAAQLINMFVSWWCKTKVNAISALIHFALSAPTQRDGYLWDVQPDKLAVRANQWGQGSEPNPCGTFMHWLVFMMCRPVPERLP